MPRFRTVLLFLLFISIATSAGAQTVSTYVNAGSGITDGLVVDSDGNLFGCDFEGTTVYKVTPEGSVAAFASGFSHPNGMTIDDQNNIYLASTWDHAIYKIDPEGNVEQYGPYVQNPNGVLFDPTSDTLIVTSYALSSLRKLAPDGTLIDWISGGDLNGPLGLTADDENRLYVANFNDGKVFRIDGNELVLLASVPSGPLWESTYACGFLTYADGYLYGTGIAVNKVYRISLEGEISVFAGTGNPGTIDGEALEARFTQPNGITLNETGDILYISDFTTQAIRSITGFTNDVNWEPVTQPVTCTLQQNYPNPFNPSTSIPFTINHYGMVSFCVYDILGREVATLANEPMSPGSYQVQWDGKTSSGMDVASGTYSIRLISQNGVMSRTMNLVR